MIYSLYKASPILVGGDGYTVSVEKTPIAGQPVISKYIEQPIYLGNITCNNQNPMVGGTLEDTQELFLELFPEYEDRIQDFTDEELTELINEELETLFNYADLDNEDVLDDFLYICTHPGVPSIFNERCSGILSTIHPRDLIDLQNQLAEIEEYHATQLPPTYDQAIDTLNENPLNPNEEDDSDEDYDEADEDEDDEADEEADEDEDDEADEEADEDVEADFLRRIEALKLD